MKRLSPFALLFSLVLTEPLLGASETVPDFDQWVFPQHSWKEADFQNRFLGRYGVNGFTEPQMDVENFSVYEGAMALIDDKAKAIEYLRNGIKNLDESGIQGSAPLHFVLGSIEYETGDARAAVDQYIQAIRKHPNFLRAYANLGFTLMELGESEKALPVLLKTVELGANESQIHGLIGRIYAEKELYESGLTAFRSALVFSPENNTWRSGALQCLIGLERFGDAVTLANEAIAFDRRNPDPWRNRAGLLLRLERWEDAIVDFQTAHALGGETLESLLNLAVLYFNKGIFGQAAQAIARAVPLASEPSELPRVLDRVLSLAQAGRTDLALDLLPAIKDRAQAIDAELDPIATGRIQIFHHLKTEAYGEAIALLDQLIEAEPGKGELHLLRGQALAAQGETEEATLALQIAATFEPTAYQAHYEHARLELARGQIDRALGLLRSAYSIRPTEALRAHIRELEPYADQR